MARPLRAAILLACVASAAGVLGLIEAFLKEIKSDVIAAKQPLEETIFKLGSSKCEMVKQILGLTFNQIKVKEPSYDELTLHYKTEAFITIYKLTYAAEYLPKALEPNLKLIIFLHGFTDNPTLDTFRTISDSFLRRGGYNVVAFDASPYIKWFYLRSSTYVVFLGRKLGEVLAAMVKGGLDPNDILLVGHSLGSHIAGATGKMFTHLTGKQIGRISALDPAGPCFTHLDPRLRLRKTDAQYVDVVHTDGKVFGLMEPVGHTDYYPNGGITQPDCMLQTCSHSRAWEIYAESVSNERAFPARRCRNWDYFERNKCGKSVISYMGFPSNNRTMGIFYLSTQGKPPFGLGKKGLTYSAYKGVVKRLTDFGEFVYSDITDAATKIFSDQSLRQKKKKKRLKPIKSLIYLETFI